MLRRTGLRRKTPLKSGTKGLKRGGRLKAVSPNKSRKRRMAKERYQDGFGVFFDEVGAPNCSVQIRRVDNAPLRKVILRSVSLCAICDTLAPVECHHVFAGTVGRSDEATNLLPVCRGCHDRIQSSKPWLGFVLFRLWRTRRAYVTWQRLAQLHGSALPALATEAPVEQVMTAF